MRGTMGKISIFFAISFLSFSLLFSQEKRYENLIHEISQKYAPDKRVAVFDIVVHELENALILKGETTIREAKMELLSKMKSTIANVIDSIVVLPAPELGD
ncbi:MAG: hypothetical protein ABDI07_09540, partial [Candidatus Kryptonium sp.]